jgi:tartrate dehydratase beta subunit/fumarate hydratase class I family protein
MKHILVVDDEADVRDLFEQRFRKEVKSGAVSFAFALNADAAMDYLKENIKSVEIVDFPELGMEAVRKIEVINFPAFIITDDKGNDFFSNL